MPAEPVLAADRRDLFSCPHHSSSNGTLLPDRAPSGKKRRRRHCIVHHAWLADSLAQRVCQDALESAALRVFGFHVFVPLPRIVLARGWLAVFSRRSEARGLEELHRDAARFGSGGGDRTEREADEDSGSADVRFDTGTQSRVLGYGIRARFFPIFV